MQKLGKLLKKNIERAGLSRSMEAYEITRIFSQIAQKILPEELSVAVTAISFKKGVLKVRCVHPSISMNLRAFEEDILFAMNDVFEKKMVKYIDIENSPEVDENSFL